MKTERPIPTEGQWYKRNNRGSHSTRLAEHPEDLVQIGEVDHARERILTKRFDVFAANGTPVFGMCRPMSFATWRKETKFTPAHEPVPQMVDRETALRMLTNYVSAQAADAMVNDPRQEHQEFFRDDVPDDDPMVLILRAYIAHLEANGPDSEPFAGGGDAPPASEKRPVDLATVLDEVRNLRADSASRADVMALKQSIDALTTALTKAFPQLSLAGVR